MATYVGPDCSIGGFDSAPGCSGVGVGWSAPFSSFTISVVEKNTKAIVTFCKVYVFMKNSSIVTTQILGKLANTILNLAKEA